MILGYHQAKSIYAAMVELNVVNATINCQINSPEGKQRRVFEKDGGAVVVNLVENYSLEKQEIYPNQKAFAAAYKVC